MATEFGPDITQTGTLQSAVTPSAGVGKDPTLLRGLSGLFEQAGEIIQRGNEKKSATAISEFTKKQLLVADALDQGAIKSSAHARTLMRKNLMDAIDMHPTLASEYIKAQSSIVDLPGAADIIKEGGEAEQLERGRRKSLVDAGLLSFDADQSTFRQVDSTVRTAEEATRQHRIRMETLDEELKMQNVTDGRRKQIEAEKEQATVDYLRASAPAEFLGVESQMKAILNDANMSEADKSMALDDLWTNWNATMSQQFGDVSEHKGGAFIKPFEMLYDSYKKRVTGEINDEEMVRRTNRTLATQKALAVSDPAIARLAVTSELFGNSGLVEVLSRNTPAFQAYVDFLASNDPTNTRTPASPFVADVDTRQGFRAYLKSVGEGLNSEDEATRTTASEHLNSVIESVSDYSGLLRRDPKSGIELVNWMASSDFQKAYASNPELFSDTSELRDALERNYDDEVWGMVQREFLNSKVMVYNEAKIKEGNNPPQAFIEAETDKGVGVRGTESGVEFFAIDPENRDWAAEAKRLNRDLRPIINNTLKAGAHLEGRTDYANVWDEISSNILGTADSQGADDGANFVISDFSERMERTESTGGSLGDVVEAGAGYTVVKTADGGTERRVGTRAWRNNNPGNIEYGSFAKSQGAIGSDGRFAVFPSYEEGRKAKANLLFESKGYAGKTIAQAISRYAPSFENDTASYARAVANAAGVTVDTPMSQLSAAQRESVLNAMERVEGFKQGRVERKD